MRIYPETLINLAFTKRWITAANIARNRKRVPNGINSSMANLFRNGLVERRETKSPSQRGCKWCYEYKITPAGLAVLYQAMHEPEPVKVAQVDSGFGWQYNGMVYQEARA